MPALRQRNGNAGAKAVLLEMANAWLKLAQQAEKNAAYQPVKIEDRRGLMGDALLDPPGA